MTKENSGPEFPVNRPGYSVIGLPITTTCAERYEGCVAPRLYQKIRDHEAAIAAAVKEAVEKEREACADMALWLGSLVVHEAIRARNGET